MKQGYEDGNYDIEYKSTDEMVSDLYTKPIGGACRAVISLYFIQSYIFLSLHFIN